jgi:uncharacterized protein DUF4382
MKVKHMIAGVAAVGMFLGCSDSSSDTLAPGQGRIALRLTDAPFPLDSVESIDVFVVRVEAKAEATTEADAQADVQSTSTSANGWIVLATPNASFDLMDLQNGVSTALGSATVAAGTYRSLRLILDTDKSSVTLKNHTTLTGISNPSILFPSAGQSGIKVLFDTPIEVDDGETVNVLLDFDAEGSFVVRGNTILQNGLLFKPVIKATIQS